MPYKDPAVRKAKNQVYSREYRKRHREERNAAARKYHAEHREQIHERKRIYNAAHKAETRARNVAYYRAHKAERIAMVMKWCAENPELVRVYRAKTSENRRLRMMVDSVYYAKCRALVRVSYARSRVKAGCNYRPRFCRRVPDWATLGQRVLDAASPFLDVNITPSQRAYARELAIERANKRCR